MGGILDFVGDVVRSFFSCIGRVFGFVDDLISRFLGCIGRIRELFFGFFCKVTHGSGSFVSGAAFEISLLSSRMSVKGFKPDHVELAECSPWVPAFEGRQSHFTQSQRTSTLRQRSRASSEKRNRRGAVLEPLHWRLSTRTYRWWSVLSPLGRCLNSRANLTKFVTTASKITFPFSAVASVGSPLIPDLEKHVQ